MRIPPVLFFSLVIAFAGSVLASLVLLSRLSRSEKAKPPVRREPQNPRAKEQPPSPEPEEYDYGVQPDSLPAATKRPPEKRRTSTPTSYESGIMKDPQIASVVRAQEDFKAFWKDMDRLSKARKRLDYQRYSRSSIAAAQDFLELSEPSRSRFEAQTRAAVQNLRQAELAYDHAKTLYPQRDRNNPISEQLYQQQRDANRARRQQQEDASIESVIQLLDPNNPRHAEFINSGKIDNWLEDLFPPQN